MAVLVAHFDRQAHSLMKTHAHYDDINANLDEGKCTL